jgi:NADH dehydrogenase (ubiquinone) 1 alpha subcomplex subunit 8
MASPMTDAGLSDRPYNDPTPMPENVPKVQELGVTSAPLKSAAFFIGAFCKEYNGMLKIRICVASLAETSVCSRGALV